MSDLATASVPIDPDDEILPDWLLDDDEPDDDLLDADLTRYQGRRPG